VLIWLIAISRIFQNLDNWVNYVAYAGGFAAGNYIGLILEEKLAMGIVKIQIITRKSAAGPDNESTEVQDTESHTMRLKGSSENSKHHIQHHQADMRSKKWKR
jgi:hypothetical protein